MQSPENLEGKEWNNKSSTAVPFDQIAEKIVVTEPKKRGRPKKTASVAGSDSTQSKAESAFGSATPTGMNQAQDNNSGAQNASVLHSSGIPPKLIQNFLEMPFAIAAGATGCKGVALSPEESEPLVPMVDMLAVKYLPNVGPYGVEIMFSVALLSLAGSKYLIYAKWKEKEKQKQKVSRETKTVNTQPMASA